MSCQVEGRRGHHACAVDSSKPKLTTKHRSLGQRLSLAGKKTSGCILVSVTCVATNGYRKITISGFAQCQRKFAVVQAEEAHGRTEDFTTGISSTVCVHRYRKNKYSEVQEEDVRRGIRRGSV